MADHEIAALLQEAIGLQSSSIGETVLTHALQRRMRALAIADKDVYAERLKSSTPELNELIEEVVVPETWFFRGHEPFEAMNQFLLNQWAPNHKNNLLKILSLPCSTGEEPYSITMSLYDAGWSADKFTVQAVDISSRAIAKAQEGIYSKNSFRGSDLAYRSRYFTRNSQDYCLKKHVLDQVHFQPGNVLHAEFMKALGIFDVIFFRNILIYLDDSARQRAISTIDSILAEDGILFVGHAEANLFNSSPFAPVHHRQAFAFQKRSKQQITEAPRDQRAAKPVSSRRKIKPDRQNVSRPSLQPKDIPDLERARELADKGELVKATAICEEYLKQCGPSVQAFFLLGIISEAADDGARAEKLFRKALYLDPDHEEILVFLMLLAEKNGNHTEAKTLQSRIKRLQAKRTV
jgi:chemotaxis protein methyltransferase WspC